MDAKLQQNYLQILKEELVPATGCTEPIAIAFGAARARDVLGRLPGRVRIEASGNIIKNVKSVVVPNTGGLTGIEAAAAAGIVAGRADRVLEVLSAVDEAQKAQINDYLAATPIEVARAESGAIFELVITLYAETDQVKLRITDYHTNIVTIEKNGKVLYQMGDVAAKEQGLADRQSLCTRTIYEFAHSVPVEGIRPLVQKQIDCNWAIAQEGLSGNWGAGIGRVLLQSDCDNLKTHAKAAAAAGSDARMGGCEMPVIIVSGSGNQGMTASLPVVAYAKETGKTPEALLRAVAFADLITIHLKTGIGRLSAYCGAVSAGCAAGSGVAFLMGDSYEVAMDALVNALAIVSGIVCDGAKASCAAKIASAVDAGILGWEMARRGARFHDGEGIVSADVEKTIRNVDRLGKDGMRETDLEIIDIMMGN